MTTNPSNILDCEHETTVNRDGHTYCLACQVKFIACRGCYVLGSGVPVYHTEPECPITEEEWANVIKRELEDIDDNLRKAVSVPYSAIRPQGEPIEKEVPLPSGGPSMLFELLKPEHLPDKLKEHPVYQEKYATITQFDLPDAYPELKPGNTKEVTKDGHTFHITVTRHDGIHTGRRRYMVECVTCKKMIHPATTGPDENVDYHVKDPRYPTTS